MSAVCFQLCIRLPPEFHPGCRSTAASMSRHKERPQIVASQSNPSATPGEGNGMSPPNGIADSTLTIGMLILILLAYTQSEETA
jgi:hypothetical protein